MTPHEEKPSGPFSAGNFKTEHKQQESASVRAVVMVTGVTVFVVLGVAIIAASIALLIWLFGALF